MASSQSKGIELIKSNETTNLISYMALKDRENRGLLLFPRISKLSVEDRNNQ